MITGKKKNVPKEFLGFFNSEYIKKSVQRYYGASFPGKSFINNSLELGNNILKRFCSRKARPKKEILGKMREFISEWSMRKKVTFPFRVEYHKVILKDGEDLAKQNTFIYSEEELNIVYCPRKGLILDEEAIVAKFNSPRDIVFLHVDFIRSFGVLFPFNIPIQHHHCIMFSKKFNEANR